MIFHSRSLKIPNPLKTKDSLKYKISSKIHDPRKLPGSKNSSSVDMLLNISDEAAEAGLINRPGVCRYSSADTPS